MQANFIHEDKSLSREIIKII